MSFMFAIVATKHSIWKKIISEDKTRLVRAYSRTSDIDCDFLGVNYTNIQAHSIYYNTHFTLNQNYDIYPRLNSQ